MLVSFIIPSYNSAHTIPRCLDSIYTLRLKQEEFEVIFVDDCSTDNTCEMVEEYTIKREAHHHSSIGNLILLKQPKNNRQGAARNRGVSIAKGEYICFVDSDDTVAEGIVAAIRLAKELQTDMTAFHITNANENGQLTREVPRLDFAPKQIFSGIKMQNRYPFWSTGAWAYVYNREFLLRSNYPFCEGVFYEDSDFVAVHLFYARRMTYSSELGYVVYYREGSTTHSYTHRNAADFLLLGTRMLSFYESMTNKGVHELSGERAAFADSILQGACLDVVNVTNKMLYKLKGLTELKAFYNRVDAYINRRELYANPFIHKYFWNFWTTICIKYRSLSIVLNTFASWLYRGYMKIFR